jgi:hypothetical protein
MEIENSESMRVNRRDLEIYTDHSEGSSKVAKGWGKDYKGIEEKIEEE